MKALLLSGLLLNAAVLFWSLSGRGKVYSVSADRQQFATRLLSLGICLLLAGTAIELLTAERPSSSALLLASLALGGWAQERQHRRANGDTSGSW